jgi:hypothetical protein
MKVMNAFEVIAKRNKFKLIRKLNRELFNAIHNLSEEEWKEFLESEDDGIT